MAITLPPGPHPLSLFGAGPKLPVLLPNVSGSQHQWSGPELLALILGHRAISRPGGGAASRVNLVDGAPAGRPWRAFAPCDWHPPPSESFGPEKLSSAN